MRVNLEWLREWVGFDLHADQLAEALTIQGLEVDSVEPAAPDFDGIVVAAVVDVQPHPNADRLTVCEVDAGSGHYSVVCGAPNVTKGLRTAFAPVGSTLPGGCAITPVELRGVASNGMLCSAPELGLGEDASGLLEFSADAPVGTSVRDYLKLEDSILDIDLTPNRGDCFSILGVARETCALNATTLKIPEIAAVPAGGPDTFAVTLEAAEACPRFLGRVIRNVATDRVSPLWLRERLRRAGLRPIHPVVDVTNYVMLELGQPLHSYDLSKLSTAINVRFAKPNEKLTLLDGQGVTLEPDVLVIADESGAIGMAGIMGGQSTAVESSTRDVFLEAAFFAPPIIAGRARRFGLHTDASLRFERGVDPEQQARAIERATGLLLDISGGDPGPLTETLEARYLPKREPIRLRHDRLSTLLGVPLERDEVESKLRLLQLDLAQVDDGWDVTAPSFRFDISIEEDLVEEVGRLIGYDTIPATPESSARHLGAATESQVSNDRIEDLLTARGYAEVINYSFIDEELGSAINPAVDPVRLANPISQDMKVMRRSLWPGLLTTARKNLSRQQNRLRIFEIGTQFAQGTEKVLETSVLAGLAMGAQRPEHWENDDREVDFFDVKADVEAVLALTGRVDDFKFLPEEHPALTPGKSARITLDGEAIGWLGALHPKLQQQLELKSSAIVFAIQLDRAAIARIPAYKSSSKFPWVRRDVAVVLDEEISSDQVLDCVRQAAGDLLQDITLFDIYRGLSIDSRRKSVALGLILQDTSRTLTDADADGALESVTQHLERALGATIRK